MDTDFSGFNIVNHRKRILAALLDICFFMAIYFFFIYFFRINFDKKINIIDTVLFYLSQSYFFLGSTSFGKKILGLYVIDSRTLIPVDFWTMILREIAKGISISILLLGIVNILINRKKQGWHDLLNNTYVIDSKQNDISCYWVSIFLIITLTSINYILINSLVLIN